MDISKYNIRVVQEPRGMIRVITLVFAILAFSTTSGFDTYTSFKLTCRDSDPGSTVSEVTKAKTVKLFKLEVEYPFEFTGKKVADVPKSCKKVANETHDLSKMDFTSSAQFYVATGVLSFLYSTAALVVYIFGTNHYESNPLVPVLDLGVTAVLTIFWLAGSCAWAAGVSDIKYYTKPEYIYSFLKFCGEANAGEGNPGYCLNTFPGKFTALNISLIFGFANIFLWAASVWFVFKETQFHRKPMPDQMGPPGQQSFDQFGGQMAGQQPVPDQTHFPQQRQFSEGY